MPTEWHPIDILINSAGLALNLEKLQEGSIEDWNTMIDINVKDVLYISRQVLGTMLKRNQGHIINIGSISSYQVYSGGVVYCATKFALKGISEGLKMDVRGGGGYPFAQVPLTLEWSKRNFLLFVLVVTKRKWKRFIKDLRL